jgi:hypothetical protein
MLDHAFDRERAGEEAGRGLAVAGASASRMRLEETGAPSASTGSTASTLRPWRAPRVRRDLDIAAAGVAEGEFDAGDDAGRADYPTRRSATNCLGGEGRRARRSNRNTSIASAPAGREQPLALGRGW